MGIMVALLCIIYGQSISYDYALDDAIVITKNMYARKGIEGIPGMWSHDTFRGFFKEDGKENLVAGGRYRPWTPTLFILERAIFGKKPWVGHFFNILTIILTSMLLMYVFKKLIKKQLGIQAAVFISSVCGILYAVHPVHTEVIANIKSRDEIWVLLASLIVLYLLIIERGPAFLRWIGIMVFSFIAMTSKENALFLLAILPLFYKWAYKVSWKNLIIQSIPIIVGVVIALILRARVVGLLPGEPSMELMNNPFLKWTGTTYIPFDGSEKIGTILSSLLTYLRLYIFPYPLTHDYYPRVFPMIEMFHWRSILSFVLYSCLFIGGILAYKKHQFVSLCIGLFFITLLPVSNIFFAVGTMASERFLFIPSLGLTLAIAYGIWKAPLTYRNVLLTITGVIIIVFTVLSFNRTQVWKNNFTLFSTDVKTSFNSAKVNNAMAGILLERAGAAKTEEAQVQLALKARPYAEKAISIHPLYKNAYLLLGNSYFYTQDYEKALKNYNIALRLDNNFQDALNNKFICLRTMGEFYGRVENNLRKSEKYLRKAIVIRPSDYETLRLLGINLGIQQKHRKAIEYFRKALQVKGMKVPELLKNIGIAYSGLGMQDSSQYYLQLAQIVKSQK